jgi:hypothetical protein
MKNGKPEISEIGPDTVFHFPFPVFGFLFPVSSPFGSGSSGLGLASWRFTFRLRVLRGSAVEFLLIFLVRD